MNVTGVKTVKSLPKMPQQQQTNFNLSTKVISGKNYSFQKIVKKKHKSWEFGRFFFELSVGFFLFSDSLKAYCEYIKKELNLLPVFPQKICVWFYLSNRWIFFLHSISVTNVPTLKCSLRPPLLSLIWYKRIDIFARISQFVSSFCLKIGQIGIKNATLRKKLLMKMM